MSVDQADDGATNVYHPNLLGIPVSLLTPGTMAESPGNIANSEQLMMMHYNLFNPYNTAIVPSYLAKPSDLDGSLDFNYFTNPSTYANHGSGDFPPSGGNFKRRREIEEDAEDFMPHEREPLAPEELQRVGVASSKGFRRRKKARVTETESHDDSDLMSGLPVDIELYDEPDKARRGSMACGRVPLKEDEKLDDFLNEFEALAFQDTASSAEQGEVMRRKPGRKRKADVWGALESSANSPLPSKKRKKRT